MRIYYRQISCRLCEISVLFNHTFGAFQKVFFSSIVPPVDQVSLCIVLSTFVIETVCELFFFSCKIRFKIRYTSSICIVLYCCKYLMTYDKTNATVVPASNEWMNKKLDTFFNICYSFTYNLVDLTRRKFPEVYQQAALLKKITNFK